MGATGNHDRGQRGPSESEAYPLETTWRAHIVLARKPNWSRGHAVQAFREEYVALVTWRDWKAEHPRDAAKDDAQGHANSLHTAEDPTLLEDTADREKAHRLGNAAVQ